MHTVHTVWTMYPEAAIMIQPASLLLLLLASSGSLLACGASSGSDQPNPPVWPQTVHVFGPDTPAIAATVQRLYGGSDWSQEVYKEQRAALLFKPGVYAIDVPVG